MVMSKHRSVLMGVFAAILCAMLSITAAQAEEVEDTAATPTNAIVARAFQDLGTWQGQCWTFMKNVIEDATGMTVGFDYRDGYFEAGAYEVELEDAQPGDVIQLADDSWTAPNADYNGLHTAIIYEVLGNGVFMVIDSNANFDEMVSTRVYNPAAAAARYSNINFHIYRFDGGEPPVLTDSHPRADPREQSHTGYRRHCHREHSCGLPQPASRSRQQVEGLLPAPRNLGEGHERTGAREWTALGPGERERRLWLGCLGLPPEDARAGLRAGAPRPAQVFRLFIPLIGTDN